MFWHLGRMSLDILLGIQNSCIDKSSCLVLFCVLSALPVQCSSCPYQAAGRSLPSFSCRSCQAVWSWHVWKISATSWGDWRIGNMKTSATKASHIALNPISMQCVFCSSVVRVVIGKGVAIWSLFIRTQKFTGPTGIDRFQRCRLTKSVLGKSR